MCKLLRSVIIDNDETVRCRKVHFISNVKKKIKFYDWEACGITGSVAKAAEQNKISQAGCTFTNRTVYSDSKIYIEQRAKLRLIYKLFSRNQLPMRLSALISQIKSITHLKEGKKSPQGATRYGPR